MEDTVRNQVILQLNKLCLKILKPLSSEEVQPYLRKSLQTLSSHFPDPSDDLTIEEDVCTRLKEENRDADVFIFRDLKRRLQDIGTFKRSADLIYFFHCSANYSKQPTQLRTGFSGSMQQLPRSASDSIHGSMQSLLPAEHSRANGTSSIKQLGRNFFQPGRISSSQSERRLNEAATFGRNNSAVNTGQQETRRARTPREDELTEAQLVRELIYVLMGLGGNLMRLSVEQDRFCVFTQGRSGGVSVSHQKLAERIAECGWLHKKVRGYVELHQWETSFGSIGQSFCAALHHQLALYYRLVASVESQISHEEECFTSDFLTLKRLSLSIMEPMVLLRQLAALVDVCDKKKGGALVSEVYSYLFHGDPTVKRALSDVLAHIVQPLHVLISKWIYDGELTDQFHEFFVASDPSTSVDRLWHDKYKLRTSMIPSFISPKQARKILLTGKSINFLRQVCEERASIKDRELIQKSLLIDVESIFRQDLDPSFKVMIDTAYKETSQHLLEILIEKYEFLEHVKAMRRYLLLGQGDFIQYLMDLLETNLAKPATELYLHRLSGVLETAIRATNAQFDKNEILKRLDVRLLDISPGDTGWDVFSLDYHVDGPLTTVFTPDSVGMYLRAFNFLWRAKRMEFLLSNIWRRQAACARAMSVVPELSALLHSCQLLAAEMGHLVQQVQYYINFEVIETAWVELLEQVNKADDLDHVIHAHKAFLESIIRRCLLDENSREMLSQLRAIFDIITNYQELQEEMLHTVSHDKTAAEAVSRRTKNESPPKIRFSGKSTAAFMPKFKILQQTYRDTVFKFLGMLSRHSDANLRFLAIRINYNNFYKEDSSTSSYLTSSKELNARGVAPLSANSSVSINSLHDSSSHRRRPPSSSSRKISPRIQEDVADLSQKVVRTTTTVHSEVEVHGRATLPVQGMRDDVVGGFEDSSSVDSV